MHVQMLRRLTIAAGVALLAVGPQVPMASATPVAPSTTAPPRPFDPFLPSQAAVPAGRVVNSWALSPTPASDPKEQRTRPDFSYESAPGSVIQDKATLYNFSNVPLTFQIYPTDAFNDADGSFDLLPGDKSPKDLGTWIKLPQANITVPAGTQATMPMTITVPLGASPGDHVGAILASNKAVGTDPDRKIITLDRRTGSRVYIRVAGPLFPALAVEKLHTTYHLSLNPFSGSASVTYRIINRGNIRLTGNHRAKISAPFGLLARSHASVAVPELLPGQSLVAHTTFHGILATFLAFTSVKLHADGAPAGTTITVRNGHGYTFAVPVTILALLLMVWLIVRARRSYLTHQGEGSTARQPAPL